MVDQGGLAPSSTGLQPVATLSQLPIHLVEREGFEPPGPLRPPGYSRLISPVKASPDNYVRGERVHAQPGLKVVASPNERPRPNVFAQSVLLKSNTGVMSFSTSPLPDALSFAA